MTFVLNCNTDTKIRNHLRCFTATNNRHAMLFPNQHMHAPVIYSQAAIDDTNKLI